MCVIDNARLENQKSSNSRKIARMAWILMILGKILQIWVIWVGIFEFLLVPGKIFAICFIAGNVFSDSQDFGQDFDDLGEDFADSGDFGKGFYVFS